MSSGELVHTFAGHSFPISQIKISADNLNLIVACSTVSDSLENSEKRKNIFVWSLRTYQMLPLLDEPMKGCTALAFSPKIDYLLAASKERNIYVWKYPQYTLIKTFKGHSLMITAETMSHDASLIVLADDTFTITVWDVANSTIAASFEGHSAVVSSLLITSENIIISASKDKTICLWNIATKKLEGRLQGHTSAINALALSSDEKLLVSASDDRSIRLWDLKSHKREQYKKFETKNDIVKALYLSPDSKTLFSGGKERKINLWNLEEQLPQPRNLAIVSAGIELITMSPNQKIMIIFLSTLKMQIWDAKNYMLMSEFPCPHLRSYPVFFSENDNRLVIYYDKLIDCFTGEVIFTFQPNQNIMSFFFDSKNNLYLYISNDFQLYQFNVDWLSTYLFKYLNYDSLTVLSKDPEIICNRKMSTFPFFFSFLHLISIFDKTDMFTYDKLKEIYDYKVAEVFRNFYSVDLFLNTPLDILIQRKNTTLIVKYFRLLFQYFNEKSSLFYQKSRFLNYNFKDNYGLAHLLNDLTPLIGEDLTIFSDIFDNSFLNLDPSIYDNSLVYRELKEPVFIETDSLYTNDRNFIENQLKQIDKNKGKTDIEENKSIIKAKIICLPHLNNINLEKTNDIYGFIANISPKNQIFNNKVLYLLANFIWRTQTRFYYMIEFVVFLFFFMLFNINFLVLYQYRSNIYNYESNSFNSITNIIDILIIINSLYTLINELRQMTQGIANYFKYIWNYNDIALLITAITTAILDITLIYDPTQRENLPIIKLIFSVSMFCIWFRFLSFFRALKETSFMIRLIFNVITGVKNFVFFTVIFILALSTSFYMLHVDTQGTNDIESLWEAFLVFYNTMIGSTDGFDDYDLVLSGFTNVYMILSTFVFAVMLMNLLVSIIGDHHSEIKEAEEKTRLYELINILCDTNTSLTTLIVKKLVPPKKIGAYLIQLYNEKHEIERGNIYEELEKNLSQDVGKMIDNSNNKIEEIKQKFVLFEKGNQRLIEELREEIKRNRNDFKELMEKRMNDIADYVKLQNK